MATDPKDTNGERAVERYQEAAYAALDQLDWIIRFLHRIQKPKLARALEQNRRTIIQRHGL